MYAAVHDPEAEVLGGEVGFERPALLVTVDAFHRGDLLRGRLQTNLVGGVRKEHLGV